MKPRCPLLHMPRIPGTSTSTLIFRNPTRTGPDDHRKMVHSSPPRRGPKTFSNQHEIPRLPVPDLEGSLEGYIRSLQPVIEQRVSPECTETRLDTRS